jgi:hypothetical protein
MKLKVAFAIALVSTISPVLAQPNPQPNPNPTASHLHAVPGIHDRSPRPHTHESQPHH